MSSSGFPTPIGHAGVDRCRCLADDGVRHSGTGGGAGRPPGDLFEAARVDGASTWQQIWSLTIPLLKPLFLVIILFRSFELLRVFDIVWTLTRGGPGRVTETISFHIYSRTFQSFNSAMARPCPTSSFSSAPLSASV